MPADERNEILAELDALRRDEQYLLGAPLNPVGDWQAQFARKLAVTRRHIDRLSLLAEEESTCSTS